MDKIAIIGLGYVRLPISDTIGNYK